MSGHRVLSLRLRNRPLRREAYPFDSGRSIGSGLLANDCFVGRAAVDDVAIGFWRAVRGEPEHRFERDVPMKAAVVAKDELIEIGVDMLAPQAVIRAQGPALQ